MTKKNNKLIDIDFKTTEEIEVPEKLIDQIIGQEKAVEIAKKVAKQHRHLLLVGFPGTGKSMLAKAISELLPSVELEDVVVLPNPEDENTPKILVLPKGKGREFIEEERKKLKALMESKSFSLRNIFLLMICSMIILLALTPYIGSEIVSTLILVLLAFFMIYIIFLRGGLDLFRPEVNLPKLLIDNSKKDKAPFIDATGASPASLLGDVAHDPYQSGPLRIPPHLRVIPGLIHKAHKGVLFIDEIGTMPYEVQEQLLTAIQEKKYPIYGKHYGSAGSVIRTEPVPCDFILVIAGTPEDIKKMHPALRSRIRGEGYEVFMNDTMDDTSENRRKLVQFVAQEVKRDGKIPHFTKEAVEEIIKEAQKRANTKGKLTLRLRELSGLIKLAGDIAREKGHMYVLPEDVIEAKKFAKPFEEQFFERSVEEFKKYMIIYTSGEKIGRVNAIAVFSDAFNRPVTGIVFPIVVEVFGPLKNRRGTVIASGQLGSIAKEMVNNTMALINRITGKDIRQYDIAIQFLYGESLGGLEGNSAGAALTTAIISALLKIPVRQDTAITGAISVRGEIVAVGGVTQKIEAGIKAGIKRFIIPYENKDDIVIDEKKLKEENIEIIPVKTIDEVLKNILVHEF